MKGLITAAGAARRSPAAAAGAARRWARCVYVGVVVLVMAAGTRAELPGNVVPVWGGMGHVHENHSDHMRELLQVGYHTDKNVWERNGQLLRAGGFPDDPVLYSNRFALYDRYGRWRLDPSYKAPPAGKKQGFAESVTSKDAMQEPNPAINRDFDAKFWYGQALPDGGHAWSVPRRPWIRQSVPYTCDTNPFDECPGGAKNRETCKTNKCAYGKQVGKPYITPNGGEYRGNVLVAIEVEGSRMFPSKLPSKPNVPMTSFQNGLCTRKCLNKPVFPACLDQLVPGTAVFGSEMLEGYMRPEILRSPCKGADFHKKLQGFECKCNVDRLACDPETSFCDVKRAQCGPQVGKQCKGKPDEDLLEETCGRPQDGGTCGFGTWHQVEKCVDDYT
jgi:hypothetical protein